MKINQSVELTAGLFMLLGLGALLFLALEATDVGGYGEQGSYKITARFTNIGDLKPRAPVAVAGVNIGTIESITLEPESFEAVVNMTIDARFNQLPTDTSASIYTKGVLGDKYVELEPGGSLEYLQDGDELFLAQSAVVLEELVSKYLFNSDSDSSDDS